MVQQLEEKFVFTDSYRTKDLIWDAYAGYLKHYNDYSMFRNLSQNNPIVVLGMIRYANDFYFETYLFVKDFKDKFSENDYLRFNNMFLETDKGNWGFKEFLFLRRFFNEFMVFSGIKNIIKEKDQMSAFARSQSEN